MIGFSGLLRGSENLPEVERTYADRIATASDALLSVINDILDYSKLEAEAVDLEPQPFDPRAMVQGAAAIVEDLCWTKGLTLMVETADDLARQCEFEPALRCVRKRACTEIARCENADHLTVQIHEWPTVRERWYDERGEREERAHRILVALAHRIRHERAG